MLTKKQEMINIVWITFGCVIMVLGINMFLTPSDLFTTGLMGLSQIISSIIVGTSALTGQIYFILNVPTILLGWFKVGRKFTLRTFYAVTVISLLQTIIPSDTVYLEDPLLAIITSGLFIGAGIGILLKAGASSGGMDIITLYISLVKGKSFGVYNVLLNILVIIGALLLTRDFETAVLMLISLYTIGVVIDKLHNSHEKLTLFVVTAQEEAVKNALLENYERGQTLFDTRGGLTGKESTTIMMTISKGQLYNIIETIKSADDKAFINVLPVENVVGYFQNNYKNIL